MADLSHLKPGMTGSTSIVVTERELAPAVGSGRPPVFATPMMIALMEGACVACVEHLLPDEHLSLGMHLDVRHVAPTALGDHVTATATLAAVDGRKLRFDVTARDGAETIGMGTHTRVVVDSPRFMARLHAKTPERT